jgi:hypothetical protein
VIGTSKLANRIPERVENWVKIAKPNLRARVIA